MNVQVTVGGDPTVEIPGLSVGRYLQNLDTLTHIPTAIIHMHLLPRSAILGILWVSGCSRFKIQTTKVYSHGTLLAGILCIHS